MSVRKGSYVIAGTPRTTGGVEIGDMGFAPLGIDESLNLRRYMNGQVISQTQFVSFTNKVKAAIALYPNLAATETNWQAEKTNSKLGQCGKFVVDDTAGTIRLPCVVNAQGLLGLSGIGNLVNESLPNINISSCGIGENNSMFHRTAGYPTSYVARGDGQSGLITEPFASLTSSSYQDNAPVQQEAVQYPYYIQVATGVEETLPAIREYQVNNSDYFGKSMYSDIAPDNASWLASNGSYNARSVYPDYYDWLNGKIGQVVTANGGKVVLSTDTITDYDFVVNQNDQTFRLPLLNGEEDLRGNSYETWTLQTSGSFYTASKNGVLEFSAAGVNNPATDINGWMWIRNVTTGETDRSYTSYDISTTVKLDVSKGDQVEISYGNNVTAQFGYLHFFPAVGNGTLYYYVGDTVQDAGLINAGAVLGQLSNKADIDASNFNADGKSLLSGLGMPSGRYIDLTLGASGSTYTAPANGYFTILGAYDTTPSQTNGVFISMSCGGMTTRNSGTTSMSYGVYISAKKGQSMFLEYKNFKMTGYNYAYFRFVYAEGEE